MSLLELRGVTKRYPGSKKIWGKAGSIEAVSGVSFALPEGVCLGLVGESGCGKSTLGRIVLGLEQPDSGEVLLQGRDFQTLKPRERKEMRRNLQVVFQDCHSSVNPRHTAAKIISEPIENYLKIGAAEKEEMVRELLQTVGLSPGDLDKYPHQFSGGQLQRVSIARAIALKPKLIVLDEAVSSLDVSIQAQILNLLADLKEEFGLAYIFISHDLEAVYYLADCLAVMYLGRIVEWIGDMGLIGRLKHPYSQRLLSSVLCPHPRYRRTLTRLDDDICISKENITGCRFAPRCERAKEICINTVPPLRKTGKNELVACFQI